MKILKFIPLFVIVLVVYNVVIFSKPEWLLEPELFDATHSVEQEPIAADPPEPESVAEAEPETPEELPGEYIDLSARPLASFSLPSGAKWKPIAADFLLLFAVLILYLELYKTTRMGGASAITEHVLSFLVFLVFVAEFLMIRECATSTFFIVMLLSLVDVVGGIGISRGIAKKKKAQ